MLRNVPGTDFLVALLAASVSLYDSVIAGHWPMRFWYSFAVIRWAGALPGLPMIFPATAFIMILPIRTDSPLRRTPYMNWAIIAANIIMYVFQKAYPLLDSRLSLHAASPNLLAFITYQFIHANLWHIGGNMLFLYIFGNNVNDKMGHLGYLAFYLAGGVFAGSSYVLTEQGVQSVMGASGSIAAVTGAYLILFPRSHVTILYFFILIGVIDIQGMWFVLGFFAMDIYFNASGGDGVAHMAHIGGTVFGALICLALVVVHLLPRDQFDVWALIQRWNKRRQYRDLVAQGFNPFDHTRVGNRDAEKARPLDARTATVQDLRDRINAAITARDLATAAGLYVELKTIDANQVLSRQAQLDVGTQLHHDGKNAQAAEAYETLLKAYPKLDRVEQIHLALGLLYARHLHRYEMARTHLKWVTENSFDEKTSQLARAALADLPVAPA